MLHPRSASGDSLSYHPGPNRVANAGAALPLLLLAAAACAQSTPTNQDPRSPEQRAADLHELEQRLLQREAEIDALLQQLKVAREQAPKEGAPASQAAPATAPATSKWYDKLSVRGYAQFRYTTLFGEDNTPSLNVPNDRSVNEPETFVLRRGRVILSGQVHPQLFVYAQMDFSGSVGGSTDSALQMRDFYGDIGLDKDQEFRIRCGQSKVPFGWVNMQSSQNRGPVERPDALNSAVEGERDVGAFAYWAPKDIRERFRHLVSSGLKGSGDYGVLGLGAYSGQGLNRSDSNGEVHTVARACYPFELEDKQIVELGIAGYIGRFVPTTQAIGSTTPSVDPDGVRDERVAVTAVWYPQPFGLECEWNWGTGPELDPNGTRIGTGYLQGGYVQASWLSTGDQGSWYPFLRWHFYDGGRKFGRNAPHERVNEIDLGLEWSPWPAVELTLVYTHTFTRTNTSTAPYLDAEGDDRIGFQVQVNF